MKHIVQFSGGAASAFVAWLVIKEHGIKDTVLLFHDTKAEHPDATRFRNQVSSYLGLPITNVSDGRSLWQVIEENNCLPSEFIPFCTRILKLEPAERYFRNITDDYVVYNGLGPEEWRRVQRSVARAESLNRNLRCLLYEMRVSNDEVKNKIKNEWGICLPDPYKYLEHNNCIPCFKAGQKHFYKVWKYYPEQFEKAVYYEDRIGSTVFKGVTLKDLAHKWESQQTMFDNNELEIPCMCAI